MPASKKKTVSKKKPTNSAKTKKKAHVKKTPKTKQLKAKKHAVKTKKTRNKQGKPYSDQYAEARQDKNISFIDHLNEIRSRLLVVLLAIIILTIIGFGLFSKELFLTVSEPFTKTKNPLHGFTLVAGFMARLKISILTALLATLPLMIFHVWKFIRPAIAKENRTFGRNALLASIFLFYAGIAFVYFLLLPMAVPILLDFFYEGLRVTIGIDNYISTLLTFCVGMGLLFQLPIVAMIMTKIGLLTPATMTRYRKHSIVVIWIIAAIITSQDIWTQIMVAVPLMLLYEVSILLSKFMLKRKQKREALD